VLKFWYPRIIGPSPTGRLARLALLIQSFNVKIVYLQGKRNAVAGTLFRPLLPREEILIGLPHEQYRYPQDIDPEEAVVVISRQERDRVLHEYHDRDLAAHYGVDKTYRKIPQQYFWIGMKKYIAEYLKNSADCQRYKASNQKRAGVVQTPLSSSFRKILDQLQMVL
ncbi:hypothetical protein ILUMI_14207, partial [Ignelater luminosus]